MGFDGGVLRCGMAGASGARRGRRAGSLPPMERFGFVGLPNAGKSSLVQRPRRWGCAGGALRLRHDRPQRRGGHRSRSPPRPAGRDEPEQERRARHACSSTTSAGWWPAPARARGWATSSWAGSAKSTPSSTSCGPSPTTTCRDPPIRSSTCEVLETELTLADLESVEDKVKKRQKAAEQDASLRSEVEALEAARRAVWPRARRSIAARSTAEQRDLPAALVPADQQAGARPGQRGRGPTGRRRRPIRPGRGVVG